MFQIKTILQGTNQIQHVVEGVSIPSTNDITIVNSPSGVYTIRDGIIIKNF